MSKNDPSHDRKPVHLARLFFASGAISPWCEKQTRVRVRARETWTIHLEEVTCKACARALDASGVHYPGQLGETLTSLPDPALAARLDALEARVRRLEMALECQREEGQA